MLARTVPTLALACSLVAACGCNNKTPRSGAVTDGELAITEGRLKIEQGNMMIRGERMVVEGWARRARGDALVEQGKRIEGARQARRGELLVRWGQALIEVAREMETEIGPPRDAAEHRPVSDKASADPKRPQ